MMQNNEKKTRVISIEFVVPDTEYNTFEFAEKFHEQFVGNPDYVDSNIVVHDDGQNHAGVAIFVEDVKDVNRMKKELTNAFNDVIKCINEKK